MILIMNKLSIILVINTFSFMKIFISNKTLSRLFIDYEGAFYSGVNKSKRQKKLKL